MWKLHKTLSFVFLFFLLLANGCVKDLITGKTSYNWFSLRQDIKLGQEVLDAQLADLKKHHKKTDTDADPQMVARIRNVVSKIGAVSHEPGFPFEAHYADVKTVNAWCAPGGKVMVYRGLFDEKKGLVKKSSDDELAAVLGHEIAHATARHVTESLSRNLTITTLGTVALSAISSSGAGTVQNVFGQVIEEGINLYIPYYSRGNEAEADRIGILYAAKAGYNPQAAVDLWYRACHTRGDPQSLYSSHPSDCQRAKNLEKMLPQALAEYEKARQTH